MLHQFIYSDPIHPYTLNPSILYPYITPLPNIPLQPELSLGTQRPLSSDAKQAAPDPARLFEHIAVCHRPADQSLSLAMVVCFWDNFAPKPACTHLYHPEGCALIQLDLRIKVLYWEPQTGNPKNIVGI